MTSQNYVFNKKSILQVATLCIITVGLYVVFRLWSLTKNLNPHICKPIPHWFSITAISVHLLSFFSLICFFVLSDSSQILIFSKVMHLISSIFHVVWLLKIRNRINSFTNARNDDLYWLNPFLSSFLHVIYIQYKINLFHKSARLTFKNNAQNC